MNANATREPTTPTRAAPLPHPQRQTPTHLNASRRLQRYPSLPIAVAVDASIPDRPNYATDEWARTHLSYFDTHGLTKDDIEVGMQTILNHLGAHPMSIPINGLTIVHGTGLHSVTPYDPPSARWIAEYLASHPAAFDFETLTNPGMPAPYAIHISNVTLTLAVTCFHAPADDQPPDVDPDLRLIALPGRPAGPSTATTPTSRVASSTASDAPHTNNRVHNVTSSTDKCSPYLPPNTSSQPPVPIMPTSSPTPDLRVTLSDTVIPRRPPTPPIERAPFDVAVVLLLSHSTIVAAVAAMHDAPDAVARNLAYIAADVADVLRVTDAIMQIALCITQRIANDRSLVPGSRAQFGQALDPMIILRMLVDSDIRICHAYGCAYAATQQRRGAASVFTRNAHITVIGTPRPVDDTPWPPSPGHSPHVADAIQVALRDIVALPAVLSVQLIRARPTISTDRSMPKYPSPTPITVTTHGTRTYSLSVAVLATHGEQYHPRYSILSLSADGTWRYAPYGASATLLSTDAALGTINPDPQHSFATMLVYRLCVPPADVAAPRPTARARASKRRVNHRSLERSRAHERVTAVAVTNTHTPTPMPTPIPDVPARPAPSVPAAARATLAHATAPLLHGTISHMRLHVLHSLLFEFLSISVFMPAPYTIATATARIRDSWNAFTIFASRMLGPTATALPDERRLDQLVSALRITGPVDTTAAERLHAHVMSHLPSTLHQLNPVRRLNLFLQSHLSSARPERTEHISMAEDGSYAADVVLTLRIATVDAPEVHTGFGYSMSEPTEALRLAKSAASLALLHRLLVLHEPREFGDTALFLPRRPAGNAVLAAAPGPIADGTPQLGTSKRWTQWTNGASAMLAHLPREVSLGRSFADFQLHSGRTLELQRTSDISVETIERRRRDHAAHSAGDPIWWLDAAGMFNGDYFVIARAAGDLVLIKRRSRVSMCAIGGCVSVCITLVLWPFCVSTKIRWCMLCMAAIMVVEPNRASTRGPLCMGVCTFVWCVCMGDSFNLCLQVWGKY